MPRDIPTAQLTSAAIMTVGLVCACSSPPAVHAADAPLALLGVIELPDVKGRIDHLAVDLARQRLYVAALGNDSVEVIDLAGERWTQSLPGVPEAQGILYLPREDLLVVASGGAGTCEVFDGATLARRASVQVGEDADNLRHDAARGRVLVAAGTGLTPLDVMSWEPGPPIALDAGHPEGFQLTPDGAYAYVDVPAGRAVAVVDLERGARVGAFALDEAEANYPMALVPDANAPGGAAMCVVGCRNPPRLVVRALPGGDAAPSLELSGDVDDLFYDAARRRLYAVCGEGFVDVFVHGPGGLGGRTRFASAPGARTGLNVPELDRLFVAAPARAGRPARILIYGLPAVDTFPGDR